MSYNDEIDVETFLLRVVPNLETTWHGASDDEIQQMENAAQSQLPSFYRWFLARMGRSIGSFSTGARNLSVVTALSTYAQEDVPIEPGLLLIGTIEDAIMPLYIYYDLERRVRDDAFVLVGPIDEGIYRAEFETLREMLAWSAMYNFRINTFAVTCSGTFTARNGAVFPKMEELLTGLGFTQPVRTGASCGIFDRSDAAIAATALPDESPKSLLLFDIGATDEPTLRRILGTIAKESSIEIEIDDPDPPISG